MIPEAVELVDGYRRKTLSPVEVTQAALDAIDTCDQRVDAFVLVDAEGALAAAKQSEARWRSGMPLGPGDGVPTSIKDALWTRGWPTLRGSSLIDAAGPWEEDAPCVAQLREPAPSCSERPRHRSTRRRASPICRGTASPAIHGTPPRRPADPAAAAHLRWGSAWDRGRSALTAAVQCVFLPRSPGRSR